MYIASEQIGSFEVWMIDDTFTRVYSGSLHLIKNLQPSS